VRVRYRCQRRAAIAVRVSVYCNRKRHFGVLKLGHSVTDECNVAGIAAVMGLSYNLVNVYTKPVITLIKRQTSA